MMNFKVCSEELIALETIIHVENLIDELQAKNRILDHPEVADLRDDILEAIRVELRKAF